MSWGRVDLSQLKKLEKNMKSIDTMLLITKIAKDLTARILALTIDNTQVVSGRLKGGWVGQDVYDGSISAKQHVNTLPIVNSGRTITITIKNSVEYAVYVENGHRTPNGNGWVKGQYMLRLASIDVVDKSPKYIQKMLEKELKGVFDV